MLFQVLQLCHIFRSHFTFSIFKKYFLVLVSFIFSAK
ncbi:hypothetical protein HDEF_1406 [Candidatus Hamiltonella defensa 5AT (Acyrthosiphon pisum)]|uniref:Uncharacterized protein n=1 Tax=Hamiltonella defensa subsp. Acyrthosiphon pisum (strain 5AT) TaxID=572265 RepID=C4K645_HAMD5|nr:hypothetical protein HDEF_1406 [Candidatus Hamiltonella defensa 5AT (Acyrthosiphon pisum)]